MMQIEQGHYEARMMSNIITIIYLVIKRILAVIYVNKQVSETG